MISIVDYGLGNIQAFLNVYRRLNVDAVRATNADDLRGATKVILPGVGAFDRAMQRLEASGMRSVLDDLVLDQHVPVLGVCVGMQMLANRSDEGDALGLGWIPGHVERMDHIGGSGPLALPHMGWNDVTPTKNSRLFAGLNPEPRFYFLHSYYVVCERPSDIAATANYGSDFSCAVSTGNIYGVQFHPEKSHQFGTRLLQNFAEI